jgi:hypothetical protein
MSRGAHHMCEVSFQVSMQDFKGFGWWWVVFPLRARFRKVKK